MSKDENIDYYFPFLMICSCFLSVMEGDTHRIEDAYNLMEEHNIVDEDGFAIYDDEDSV